MKKNRKSLIFVLMISAFLLSGCGTPMVELTTEEEELITYYVAHVVSKYNTYQKDGLVRLPDEEMTENEDDKSDDISKEENIDKENQTETAKPAVDNADVVAKAFGLPNGIALKFANGYVTDYIKGGTFSSVESGVDFDFYVMKFKMTNTTDKSIAIDNVSKKQSFTLNSDKLVLKSVSSMLASDLATYKDSVKAGETVDVVLLFKLKNSDVKQFSESELIIKVGK